MFKDLADALADCIGSSPASGRGLTVVSDGTDTFVGHPELAGRAMLMAGALDAVDVREGDRVAIIVPEPKAFVTAFLGCVWRGAIPVPMYPPMALVSLASYARTASAMIAAARPRVVVATGQVRRASGGALEAAGCNVPVVTTEELDTLSAPFDVHRPKAEDTLFLQFTSGSTRTPRGVVVTHESLARNAWSCIEGIGVDLEAERFASWLPLYHDMGLIAFVLVPVLHRLDAWLMPTLDFVKHPLGWIDMMHRSRAAVSSAPNFAYGLVCKRVRPADLERWDLSAWRVAACGAEPVHAGTMRAFARIFGRCGLPRAAMTPVYGMAEATLMISVGSVGEPFRSLALDAEALSQGRVVPAAGDVRRVEVVSCGRAAPGHELVVVDPDGRALPPNTEGEIVFRGPSVTPGYYDDAAASVDVFRDGWLHTGDLGFLHEGEIHVTGRKKDVIILRGRNHHPHEIEWAAAEARGVRKGGVVAFSVPGEVDEQLVIVAERRERGEAPDPREVADVVSDRTGLRASEVMVLEPGGLPKTTSGKLRRRHTRDLFGRGSLAETRQRGGPVRC